MKFGIRLIQHLGSPRDIVELGVLADRAGFDHAWFPSDKFLYHAWPMMVTLAENTEQIVVGPNGIEPYAMSPGETATFMATQDLLCNGRTALGFGMHTDQMIEWMGIKVQDRVTRIREAVDLMRRIWRGEVAEFQGREFNWSDQCYLRFQPLRDRIPIYVSGYEAESLALTGEIGDGSLPMITPPESAPLMVERVATGAARVERDLSEIDICGCGWFSISADGKGTDTDELKDILAYFGYYLEEEALNTVGLSRADFKEIFDLIEARDYAAARALVTPAMYQLAVTGTPRDAIKRIEALFAAGITQVSVGGPMGPDPRETIRLFGEQVIPYFR
ncbi:MAG: LLM class flavin-dependent oxidoreductase [Gammaproteobacteria bacterium]|nr:LLM class flavin-dependent oxidoreductase [Gammaproteobacteria bacterium]